MVARSPLLFNSFKSGVILKRICFLEGLSGTKDQLFSVHKVGKKSLICAHMLLCLHKMEKPSAYKIKDKDQPS